MLSTQTCQREVFSLSEKRWKFLTSHGGRGPYGNVYNNKSTELEKQKC